MTAQRGVSRGAGMSRPGRKGVLFLCTGNYYRSRFAELFFNSVAGKMGLPWSAVSRGLALERGVNNVGPMAAEVAAALGALGVAATADFTRPPAQATAADFEQAQRVVVLKRDEHWPLMQERFPAWAERVEYWHVDDAPGVLPAIEQEVMGLIARLLGGGQRPPDPPAETRRPEPGPKPVTVKVGRETKGRRGKGVTTVWDVPLGEAALAELATLLKQRVGTGGTVRDGRIEIQGDQRERVAAELEKLGYKVKRVGG
ncbi:MAG: hypothetical protein U0746_09840 [Gemmataceae bacterium]